MRFALAPKALTIGAVGALTAGLLLSPAGAATEAVNGTAISSGGNGFTSLDLTYTTTGSLGAGTIHAEFVISSEPPGIRTAGTAVLTRSDGATLSGTETSTVDTSTVPFQVVAQLDLTDGVGALAGATAQLTLTGTSLGPGTIGDVFTITGTLTTPTPVATAKEQCKNAGWLEVVDDSGLPFANQGLCVRFVESDH